MLIREQETIRIVPDEIKDIKEDITTSIEMFGDGEDMRMVIYGRPNNQELYVNFVIDQEGIKEMLDFLQEHYEG